MFQESARPATVNRHSPPIVGRSAERILLYEQLGAIASGHGQLCIVSGEAGIGKTTLVQEVITEATRRHMQVLIGQSYDLMAAPPYGIWLDLASNYIPSVGTEPTVPLPEAFSNGELNDISSQMETFEQVRMFLTEISALQPTILVLEDVHWADPVSLELVRHITSRLAHLRMCVVITYRVDELTLQNPLYRQLPALIRESGGLRVDLGALRREDIVSLVEMHYSMQPHDQERLVNFLVIHSEGNPFFVVELLRALENRGLDGGLWQGNDAWNLAELAPLVVPALVRQVIDLRLERLGPNVRKPLSLAAVIGQDVPIDLWQSIVEINETELLAILDVAVEWHIVNASPDGTRIRFVHALTREALYSSILPPRRRVLHREVAEALMKRARIDPDAVAFHLHQSGDSRTAEWMIRAGERAQRAYAWLTARDQFFTAAEAMTGVAGQELLRSRLLYRCGRLMRYANAEQGITDISLARRLAEVAGDDVLAAEAEYSLGLLQCYADKYGSGVGTMESGILRIEAMSAENAELSNSTINWFADALPTIFLPSQNGIDSAAACLADLGVNHRRGGLPWFLAYAGQLDRAVAEAESYVSHVHQCGTGPLVLAASGHSSYGLGIAHAAKGEPAAARTFLANAREQYASLDHHAVIAFTLLTELQDVVLRYETVDLSERQLVANNARAALEKAGGALPFGFSMRRAELPLMWIEGRWDEARMVVAEDTTHGNSMLRRPVTTTISRIDYHQGRTTAVWAHVHELLPAGPATEPGSALLPDALLLQSLAFNLALDDGDIALAKRWLDANNAWLQWSGSVAGQVEHYLDHARLNMLIENGDTASKNAERALELSDKPRQPFVRIAALRMRGAVGGCGNDRAQAESDFRAALALADACAAPFERALTLLEMLRAGIDIGEDDLRDALIIGKRLHAITLLSGLEDVTGTGRTAGVSESDLTARESDVLKLAATGLTDIEIGHHLSISHRTVGQHLRSVYAKLDVHSRAAATRFAIEHELM